MYYLKKVNFDCFKYSSDTSDYFGYGLKLENNQLQSKNSVENQCQGRDFKILKFTGARKLTIKSINFFLWIKI